jgi:hypothetical protein
MPTFAALAGWFARSLTLVIHHDPRPDKGLEGPRRGSEEVSLTTIPVKNR